LTEKLIKIVEKLGDNGRSLLFGTTDRQKFVIFPYGKYLNIYESKIKSHSAINSVKMCTVF